MQKALSNQTAQALLIVEVSPTILREIADRLDASGKTASRGESVQCPLTRGITFLYNPDRNLTETQYLTDDTTGIFEDTTIQ